MRAPGKGRDPKAADSTGFVLRATCARIGQSSANSKGATYLKALAFQKDRKIHVTYYIYQVVVILASNRSGSSPRLYHRRSFGQLVRPLGQLQKENASKIKLLAGSEWVHEILNFFVTETTSFVKIMRQSNIL
jgi:hypothetical protein